jgi:hypothetical protein
VLVATDLGNAGLDLTSGTPTPPFQLGQRTNQFGTNPFEGLIDEVRVFDSALSAGEIDSLYRLNEVPEPSTAMLAAIACCMARRRFRR